MIEPTAQEILNLPMQENDAGAKRIRDYLVRLLHGVWSEQECFNGKSPFGNSGWSFDLTFALARNGVIEASYDENWEEWTFPNDEWHRVNRLISKAIEGLRG